MYPQGAQSVVRDRRRGLAVLRRQHNFSEGAENLRCLDRENDIRAGIEKMSGSSPGEGWGRHSR